MLRKTALTMALVSALAAPALADTITFKNGHEVHGRLIEETDKHVIFQVGNGKLKFDKKEIATFTEDADYGQRYFSVPKRQGESDNLTVGVDGKSGRTFNVPDGATPEERKDLKGVHSRIDEELAKLGPSNEERVRKLDLLGSERATLDAAIASFGKGRSSVSEVGAFGVKAIPALGDALQNGDSGVRADAAAALDDAVGRGDEQDVKWALGRYKIATRLADVLDASGDEKAAQARNAANHALERISSAANGWTETKDAAPTESQRAATAKWKAWAKKNDLDWETADKEREAKRRKMNADRRDLEDPAKWRKTLSRAVDEYGTTVAEKKKDGETASTPKDTTDATNPDIAKSATPEQQKALSELKAKLKKTLDEVVGLSVEDKKKKYAPTSDELQDMKFSLDNLRDRRNKNGGVMQRQNAIKKIVSDYGIKAIAPLAEALEGENVVEDRNVATAIAGIVGGDKREDALTLIHASGMIQKLAALLEFTTDSKSAAVRAEGNKALEAISGTNVGWPAEVSSQTLTPEESEAKAKWKDWVAKDAADFARTEKLREEHRKTLTELQKKLDSPRSWKEALDAGPGAITKAERDLSKK